MNKSKKRRLEKEQARKERRSPWQFQKSMAQTLQRARMGASRSERRK